MQLHTRRPQHPASQGVSQPAQPPVEDTGRIVGLLPIGVSYLAGPSDVNKTAFATQAAMAAEIGGEFLGRQVAPTKVLYLTLAETEYKLAGRLKLQAAGLNANFANGNVNFHLDWSPLSAGGLEEIDVMLALHRYELVVIDPFSRLLGVGEHKQPAVLQQIFSSLAHIAQHRGAAILLLDHHPKLGRAAGASDKVHALLAEMVTASGGIVLSLHRRTSRHRRPLENAAKLKLSGGPAAEDSIDLLWDPATLRWNLKHPPAAPTDHLTWREREALAAVTELDGPTLTELVVHLRQDKGNLYRRLQSLCRRNLLTTTPGPRGNRYLLPPQRQPSNAKKQMTSD